MQERNHHFDQVKGLLIILVIIGHVAIGSLNNNLLRYIIYFFHMPLFLAITGYFISQKTIQLSIVGIIKKYTYRLLIPFGIAFSFYTNSKLFNIDNYLYPYYHLWYIPAILLFVFYTKIIDRIYYISKTLFLLFLLGFILTTIFFESYSQWNLYQSQIYYLLGDKRFFYFFSYFFLGYILSKKEVSINLNHILITISLMLIINIFTSSSILNGISKTIINYCIIYLVIQYCTAQHSTAQHSTAQF